MLTTKLKKQLESEDFWSKPCVHSGKIGVQAEHCFTYGRKQIQERWNIIPVAPEYNYNPSAEVKEQSQLYALEQCKEMGLWEETIQKYPKKNWNKLYNILSQKYRQ